MVALELLLSDANTVTWPRFLTMATTLGATCDSTDHEAQRNAMAHHNCGLSVQVVCNVDTTE